MKPIKAIFLSMLMLLMLLFQGMFSFAEASSFDTDVLDKLINVEMVNYNLPGVAVSVVQNGEALYTGTFGYADLEKEIQVTPDETIFQTGSIAKVFTSVALLKLMQENGVQPEDQIAPYLPEDLSQKEAFKALTFRNILDHTSGIPTLKANSALRENPVGLPDASFRTAAGSFLQQYKLLPVIEPGKYTLFSNVNNILAGVLVESLSGMSYEKYLADHVLSKMNMRTSSLLMSGDVLDHAELAQNYSVYGGNRTVRDPFRARFLASDDFLTTAEDMTTFMSAMTRSNLNPALYEGLFTQQVTNSALTLGRSFGFAIVRFGTYEGYVQDGGIPGSSARLLFIPSENLAIFIAYNSDSLEAREAISQSILKALLGAQAEPSDYEVYQEAETDVFTGSYQPINASDESVERLTQVIHQVRIQAGDKALLINGATYTAIAPTVFIDRESGTIAEFQLDDSGQIAYLVIGNTVYKRATLYQSFLVEAALLVFSAFFNIIALILVMMRWGAMRVNRIHDTPRVVLLLHTLTVSVLMLSIFLISTQYDIWNIIYGGNLWFSVVKAAGVLNVLLILPSIVMLNRAKSDFRWSGFMIFIFRLQQILSVFLFFWLYQYNFI